MTPPAAGPTSTTSSAATAPVPGPRRHRGARPRGARRRRALQHLLRQRLPDPAGGAGVLAPDRAWCCATTAARSSTRRGASGCSTYARRRSGTRLAEIVGRWAEGCARDGFDAVEYDNLDSFTRSHGLITPQAGGRLRPAARPRRARAGLAAGQKNLAGFDGTTVGFDFAVAEECGRYRRVRRATSRDFGDRVLAIEYRRARLPPDLRAVRRPARGRAARPRPEPDRRAPLVLN